MHEGSGFGFDPAVIAAKGTRQCRLYRPVVTYAVCPALLMQHDFMRRQCFAQCYAIVPGAYLSARRFSALCRTDDVVKTAVKDVGLSSATAAFGNPRRSFRSGGTIALAFLRGAARVLVGLDVGFLLIAQMWKRSGVGSIPAVGVSA